jgi:hypothetical protein
MLEIKLGLARRFATTLVRASLAMSPARPSAPFFSSGRRKTARSRPRILVFVRIWAFIHPASPGHPRSSGACSGTPVERNARETASKSPGLSETSSPPRTLCRSTRRSTGPGETERGRRRSSSGGCWTWRPHNVAPPPPRNPLEVRRSSSWRTPATTTSTGLRRHASATLGRVQAARRRHRRTAATLATTATTRRSTAD